MKVRSDPGEPTRTSDSCSFYLLSSMPGKQEFIKTRTRLGFKGRLFFWRSSRDGEADISELAPDRSEERGGPFEEPAPANSRLSLPKTQSPTICNKCAPLKQYHMDNKLAINTASAHPLNLAQISNFQSN